MVSNPNEHILYTTTMRAIQHITSSIGTLWLTATLTFFALRVLPGDAIQSQLIQSGASPIIIAERREQQGLTNPIEVQYTQFLTNLLQGNLGYSLINSQPVTELIAQHIIPTLTLATGALIIATPTGLLLGITAALDKQRSISTIIQTIISLSLSTPIYWTGTIAIFMASALFEITAPDQVHSPNPITLPIFILGFHTSGSIARLTYTNVRETLLADFVRTAHAKGLTQTTVIYQHVLRVSLLPTISIVALQSGFLLSGTVITEMLFTRPGLGKLLLSSVLQQDYPVVQGLTLLFASIYITVNTLADLLSNILDPRMRQS